MPTTIQCTAVRKQTITGQRTEASTAASSGSVETNPLGATVVGNKVAMLLVRWCGLRRGRGGAALVEAAGARRGRRGVGRRQRQVQRARRRRGARRRESRRPSRRACAFERVDFLGHRFVDRDADDALVLVDPVGGRLPCVDRLSSLLSARTLASVS